MEHNLVLNVVYPPGHGAQSKEKTFVLSDTIASLKAKAVEGTSMDAGRLMVVAETNGSAQYMNTATQLKEFNLSQKSTIYLFRHEQICLVLTTSGERRRLLIDFSAPLEQAALYVAVKLGVSNYESLNLRPYGTAETLRNDRSLQDQGIVPVNRLFCLTLSKDEQPVFPQDAIDMGFVSSALAPGADTEANLLNVPEEMLTRATKRGALEKLNTKKGRWSTRFFVLQDSDLYYYTEAKAKRAKNILHEPVAAAVEQKMQAPAKKTSTLRKLASGRSEKFDFVVSAGSKTVRLSCKSADEGAAWIAAINNSNPQQRQADAKGNSNAGSKGAGAVFRNDFSAAVSKTDGSEIPAIVVSTIEYLDKPSILKVVGLFRLSGSAPTIQKLSEDIDAGKTIDFSTVADPHTVSGLLKLYFRESAEPLLTWDLFAPFTASCAVTANCISDKVRYLKQVINMLPPLNKATLAYLMKFLAKVVTYSAYNKMPLHNIATVFAPNILRERDASMLQIVEATSVVNNAVITILEYHDYLLGDGEFPVKSEFPPRPYATALHPFEVTAPGDLALAQGDIVGILVQGSDGWWYGESAGKYGRFPGSYMAMLDEKEADKMRKKVKIDVKIQEMREQADHREKQLSLLGDSKTKLQAEIDELIKQTALLQASEFPTRVVSVAASMPQFATTSMQYREALGKMLQQSQLSASEQQELLIALNGLWSQANNPKLQKKYKKVLHKLEPALVSLRESLQQSIQRKHESMEVRADLMKDLEEFSQILAKSSK